MDPHDLVPGIPEDVELLAVRLNTYAEGAEQAVARLEGIADGTWVGEAAEAFRDAVGQVPARLERGIAAFQTAALELSSYASTLRESQALAAHAVELFNEAERQTRAWSLEGNEAPSPGEPFPAEVDPGEALRSEARRLVTEARRAVEESADRAAARLAVAAEKAPNKPGLFDRALGALSDFTGGAVEATAGMAEFAFKLTPVYELIDPKGYVENLTGLARGLVFGVTHPVDFAKAIVDWDTWLDDPARALGHLVPTLALAAATAGAGAAGKAGGAAKAAQGVEAAEAAKAAQGLQATAASALRVTFEEVQEWRSVFRFTERQLQAKFKHAADFGVEGNFNPAKAERFADALRHHVLDEERAVIEGTYRGKPAVFHVDPDTGLAVIHSTNGGFVSGWKLNAQQLRHVLEHGTLGGTR